MKTVAKIYEQYDIIPNLQMHQLRVAAVATLVSRSTPKPHDGESVVIAALFHDMGNIIKFDLSLFPEFREPKGVEYWQDVKKRFVEKYGTESHAATEKIAREIGLGEKVIDIINAVSFSNLEKLVGDVPIEKKIVEYADDRVGPHGVIPTEERFKDAVGRYAHRYPSIEAAIAAYAAFASHAKTIEEQLFAGASIRPEDINDQAVGPIVEELRNHEIA